jgi:hypothetical protein
MTAAPTPPPDLTSEVRALQTRVRWLIGIVVLLGLVVVWREGVTRGRLEARAFVLVDDNGIQRGIWRTWGPITRLVIQDVGAVWRINLQVGDDGNSATLHGPGESTEVQLTTVDDRPVVKVSGHGNQAVLEIADETGPRLTLTGPDGTAREVLPGGGGSRDR